MVEAIAVEDINGLIALTHTADSHSHPQGELSGWHTASFAGKDAISPSVGKLAFLADLGKVTLRLSDDLSVARQTISGEKELLKRLLPASTIWPAIKRTELLELEHTLQIHFRSQVLKCYPNFRVEAVRGHTSIANTLRELLDEQNRPLLERVPQRNKSAGRIDILKSLTRFDPPEVSEGTDIVRRSNTLVRGLVTGETPKHVRDNTVHNISLVLAEVRTNCVRTFINPDLDDEVKEKVLERWMLWAVKAALIVELL